MDSDIRWKQRFENFEKSFQQLVRFIEKGELNEFEEQGLIQCFEYNYDLAWNLMKDFLTFQGIVGISGSRDAIRQAFNKEIISHGEEWMKMVDDRIRTVHSYNEDTAQEIIERIKTLYFPMFQEFYAKMKSRL